MTPQCPIFNSNPQDSSPGGATQQQGDDQAARERAQAQDEMKRSMIVAMLEPAARERCELSYHCIVLEVWEVHVKELMDDIQ